MSEGSVPSNGDPEREARRAFLRQLGVASVAVPAVTLVLAAAAKAAFAHGSTVYGCNGSFDHDSDLDSDFGPSDTDSDSDSDSDCDSDSDDD